MTHFQFCLRRRRWAKIFVLTSALVAVASTLANSQETASEKTDAPEEASKDTPAPTPAEKKAPQTLEKIEVTTSQAGYDARQDDTATKIVVTSEEIKKYGDTQVLDVLKRLPGVTVQGSSIRLRGLGNGYTQILIDGERPPPGFSIENLSPDLIERIEIIRAATAEFSTQAIAGTLNIIMKKKYSVSQRDLNAGWYSGTGYQNKNLSFQIADSAGKLAFSVGGYGGQSTNGLNFKSTTVGVNAAGQIIQDRLSLSKYDGDSKYIGLFSNLAWTLGGGNSFTMRPSLNAYRYNNVSDGETRYLVGETTPYPIFRGRNEGGGDSFSNNANLILKLAEGAKLDLKLNMNYSKRDNDGFAQSFNTGNVQTLERSTLGPSKDTSFSFAGKYSTPIVEGHALLAGWDVGLNRNTSSTELRETNIATPPLNTNENYNAKVQKLAFFAQDEWNVTSNWSVYFGLRWEGIETTGSGNAIETAKNRSGVTSPLFQTLWKFPDKSGRQLRMALTRTYKAPDTLSLIPRVFRTTVNTSTAPDYQSGNANLKPELATGVDLAYEHFWAKGASMSLSGTLRTITDYNTRDIVFTDNRWVNKPINRGRATSRSIEFDAKFPLQTVYADAPPIDFRFNMARNFSSVDEVPGPNNRLDQQTPFNATFGADYRMRGGMIVAGASYTFRSGGDVRTSITQSRYVTPKRDLDMYVLYKYTPKLQFRLRLANILRQDTVNSSTFTDATSTFTSRNSNNTAMNVGASVEFKF
jgi:outer membrane receptor for ferrienterochelin and colicins